MINNKNLEKKMVVHETIPDLKGMIYCRKDNKVRKMDMEICRSCKLLSGSAQGMGVECYYEDSLDKHIQSDPYMGKPNEELLRISNLIDAGLASKIPVRKDS